MAASRGRQPTFNLFTGEDASKPDRDSSIPPSSTTKPTQRRLSVSTTRKSGLPVSTNGNIGAPPVVRATIDNENLRAALNKLQYEFDTYKGDAAVAREALLAETRELERRVEAEIRRAAEADRAREAAAAKLEGFARDGRDAATRAENERRALEKRIRDLGEEVRVAREEVEDVKTEAGGVRREAERQLVEVEGRHDALVRKVEESGQQVDWERKAAEAAGARAKAAERKAAELEGEMVVLKASAGDGDLLAVVRKELSEQVAYVKKLERSNNELEREVKRFTRERKAVEVVEEEKKTLEGKLGLLDGVRRELAESELRRQVLEDERRAWSTYLDSEQMGGSEGFDGPEELARAFIRERSERVQLLDKVGRLQPELAVKDEVVAALETDKSKLEAELKKAKQSGGDIGGAGGETKARARIERQRILAIKEVEYLRAQLKSLEDETTEFDPSKAEQRAESKTSELEGLVDEYRTELAAVHAQLTAFESTQPTAPAAAQQQAPDVLKKRTRDEASEAEDERLGSLRRKLRKMTDTVSGLETQNSTLAADLAASRSQLSSLRDSTRTRVLELQSNPTAAHEATKASTLRVLRDENAALLARLQDTKPRPASVPAASLAALQARLEEKDAELAQRDKKALRLKTIWAAKAREFTDAIASTLGWNVTFLPQGKLKLSSVYYASSRVKGRGEAGEEEEEEEEEENFILFDGEKGTMKISGGEKSRFARELREMVEFWVEGRGEVPCFLAAANLEFWERKSAAQQVVGKT